MMFLSQQSYAIKNQLGLDKEPAFTCSSLVLYGIGIVGFHARESFILFIIKISRRHGVKNSARVQELCTDFHWFAVKLSSLIRAREVTEW